jgi:hypothetical protein
VSILVDPAPHIWKSYELTGPELNADFRGAKSPHSPIRAWQHFSRRMGDLSSVL